MIDTILAGLCGGLLRTLLTLDTPKKRAAQTSFNSLFGILGGIIVAVVGEQGQGALLMAGLTGYVVSDLAESFVFLLHRIIRGR